MVYYGDASGYSPEQIYYASAAVPQYRAAGPVVMNAVSERDADGNPVTQQEMFDTKWVALCLVIMLAALAKSAGAFAVQGKASAAVPQSRAGPV